jgi:hypothetical protein
MCLYPRIVSSYELSRHEYTRNRKKIIFIYSIPSVMQPSQ